MRQASRFAGRYRSEERIFTEMHILKFTKLRDLESTPKMWEWCEYADKNVVPQVDSSVYSQRVSEWRIPCYDGEHETLNCSPDALHTDLVRTQSAGANSGGVHSREELRIYKG